MQTRHRNIFFKFFWSVAIVLGLGMFTYGQGENYYEIDVNPIAFQNDDVSELSFNHHHHNQDNSPVSHSPLGDSSSNEENGEEENEETNDSEFDGELSHYQVDSSLNPYSDTQAFIDNSKVHGSYNIPLYILFHCWRSFIS